ncbi:unnamed protein product [Heterobilharzia americana]|nr:unnamed protein product [Heterobilharzia americana]
MVVMGFQADAKAIVEAARDECSNYRDSFGSRIPLYSLTERLAMYMHAHTLYSAVRPFGVSVLLGSYESDGPHLYVIEPSGLSFAYFGCAIGKAKQSATTEIEKLKINDLSPEEMIKEAAKIIYTVHDEIKDKNFELDLSWVGANTKGVHQSVSRKLFDDAETFAKQALEEADDLDDEVE